MSTPVCRGRSLRIPRSSERRVGVGCSSRGHAQTAEQKCRHEYDPYLEIRKARERLSLYKSKGDCAPDEFLSLDSDRDLQRYEEKLRRRYSEQGDFTGEIELERRRSELLRRQRDIDVGKTTEKYAEYVLKIPKPEREKHHPRTPNKFRVVSRRGWDGMIRKWRRDIHNYENLNSDETWHSLASDVSVSSNSRSPSPGHRAERLEHATASDERGGEGGKPSMSKEYRQPDELETDEDTLQGGKKVMQCVALAAGATDEETLNDDDVKWNLRRRKVPISASSNVPSPDVIHSGLTTDLTTLGVKRDDLSISAMLSPNKRARTSRSRSTERPRRTSGRKRNPDKRS
ncbi:Histone RNA hairpin-binding protein [Taenia solium]|eukprot:TsM_000784700 transcript=TsM_000784700 gene=TsM_000784700